MLPAKFRGFASRVCRLASRALAWHKTSECDGALNATASANSNSDASAYRSVRTSGTLLRALFAMLIAAATLFAMLIVPAKPANAAQVMWSYGGYGYFTANGNGIGNAVENMHITPSITKDSNGTHVQYEIYFNYAFLEHLDNQPRQRMPARVTFYVDLPKQLITDTIRVKRDRRNVYEKKWNEWSTQNDKNIPETMKTWDKYWGATRTISRWHYTYGNTDFNDQWEDTVGNGHFGCGYNQDTDPTARDFTKNYSLCEIKKWHDNGDFGIMLRSYESANSTTCYRWVITADVPDGTDIRYMPIIAGYQSTNAQSHERHYATYGPYDHDGDGIPDNVEWDNSTDPTKPGGLHFEESEDSQPRQASSVRAYTDDGHWQENGDDYYNNKGSFVPDYGSDGKRGKLYNNIPKNLIYSIDGNAYFDNNKSSNAQVTFDDPNNQKPEPLQQGHAWIDKSTGKVYFNPADSHKNHIVYIPIKVTYPNPNKYNCNHNQPFSETVVAKFRVWPMSHFYKPVYPDYDKKQVQAGNSITSVPKNEGITKGDFPKGTRFELGTNNNYSSPVLSWSKITNASTGEVTFTPSKPQDPKNYDTPVIAYYPDGSSTKDNGQVYAHVKVTPLTIGNNDLGFSIAEGTGMHDWGSKYDDRITYGSYHTDHYTNLDKDKQIDSSRLLIPDAWSANNKSPITFRAICHEKNKDNYTLLKWDEEKNKSVGDVNGLKFTAFHQWKIATEEEENKCRNDKNCNLDDFKYSHLTKDEYNTNIMARSRAIITGKPEKSGEYECRVFAFNSADRLNGFDNLISNDTGGSVIYKKMVFANYGNDGDIKKSKGKDWNDSSLHFSIKLKDNQKYNPTYTEIPTIEAGSTYDKNLKKGNKADISSDAPQSKKKVTEGSTEVNANGVPKEDLANVKEGALPPGTWYEIKRFVKAGDIKNSKASSLPWANFEDGEDNKADGKQEAKDSNATGKGSVTFRPDKWQSAGEYWSEVRVHYPDGSVSDDDDSINKNHPIYAKVKVTRPAIDSGDLHLNVYKQYENGKFTGYVDDVNGITVMKGVGLLKDMGIDSWSTAKPEGITLRALCRDDSDEAKKNTTHIWSENLDNLFFKLNWQKSWDHADFQQQETCRKSGKKGDGCNPEGKYLLFDSTGGTMERASGTITSDKAPTKSGKYYCVVLAMKLTDLGKYKNAIKNSKISVTNNNFAKAMGFTDTEGIDYAAKFFPVTVVDKFTLPKTGGEGMSMALLVVAMIGMCVMCGAFFVDQTKWGHAMLAGATAGVAGAAAGMMGGLRGIARGVTASITRNSNITQNINRNSNSKISEIWRGLVKKVKDIRRFDDYSASVKDFVRKATGWLRAALRRVGRWAAERWRC